MCQHTSNCDYVRHCDSEFRWYLSAEPYVLVFPSFTFARIDRRDRTNFDALVQVGPWSHGQPWPATNFDCTRSNNGCPQDWPYDASRSATTGWGFSHRSKVCVWEDGYTWVLRQDPLGLLAQAMHILLKYNDPWRSYNSPWPWGVPGGPPSTVTPISMVDWVWNRFWRTGVGCTMYNVPVIGSDQRVSSLRTNQMLVATTLLGYRYLLSQTWRNRADAVAGVLRQVQVGGYGQPVNGIHSIDGEIVRPDYFGSQAFVWDALDPHVRQGGAPTLGVVGFGWLRQTINAFFNLPNDDEDWILSTVETTATYAQAWRAYLYHKFNILAGNVATIPGH